MQKFTINVTSEVIADGGFPVASHKIEVEVSNLVRVEDTHLQQYVYRHLNQGTPFLIKGTANGPGHRAISKEYRGSTSIHSFNYKTKSTTDPELHNDSIESLKEVIIEELSSKLNLEVSDFS